MELGLTFAQVGVHPPVSLHVLRHVVHLQLAHQSPNLHLRLKPSASHCPPTLKPALTNPPTNKLHLKATNHRLHVHPPINKLYLKATTHSPHPPTNKLYLKATNHRLHVHPPTNKLYLKATTHNPYPPTNKLYLKATTHRHLQPALRFARSQTVVHNAISVVALRLLPTFSETL